MQGKLPVGGHCKQAPSPLRKLRSWKPVKMTKNGPPSLGLCPMWHLYPCTLPRRSRALLWDIPASGGVEMMSELRGSWRAWAARGANALETFAGFYLNEHSFPPPREFSLRPKAQDLITLSQPVLTQLALLLLKLPVQPHFTLVGCPTPPWNALEGFTSKGACLHACRGIYGSS